MTQNHDLVRIDKFLAETVQHLTQQVQSFNIFTQTKKGWNNYSNVGGSYPASQKEPLLMQYIGCERDFEDAHNNMISRLNYFQSLNSRDKINHSAQF